MYHKPEKNNSEHEQLLKLCRIFINENDDNDGPDQNFDSFQHQVNFFLS